MIFSAPLRNRYGKYWTKTKLTWMLRFCYLLATLLYITSYFISQLYLTIGMMGIILVVLIVLIYYSYKLKVYDKVGIMQENARLLGERVVVIGDDGGG